jgi:hypothetical protein
MRAAIKCIFRQTAAHPCAVNQTIAIFAAVPMGATHLKLLYLHAIGADIGLSIVTA